MLVYFRAVNVNKRMNAEIIVLISKRCLRKVFKLLKCDYKLLKIAEIKMCIEQVVHSFNIVTHFHCNHSWLRIKQVNPLLTVPVVHQKILPYKCVPAIALIQV